MAIKMKSRQSRLLVFSSFLAAASLPLCLAADSFSLLAVQQVLPSLVLLPEDVKVKQNAESFFFEDSEVTGKLEEGTAVIKVADNAGPQRLQLFTVTYAGGAKLTPVVAASGFPVFCDYRPNRQCFTKSGESSVEFLSQNAILKTETGSELVYLKYPGGGSVLARPAQVNPAATSAVLGQFNGELEMKTLNCSPFGPVSFPRQLDSSSYSLVEQSEGDLQFCEVTPPLVTGKQIVAVSNNRRAPPIYCDSNSNTLLFFEPHAPHTNHKFPYSQQMELKLTGQPATCEVLKESQELLLSVKRFEAGLGKAREEQLFVLTSFEGKPTLLPTRVQLFSETELGAPCPSQGYHTLYQPNYLLHSAVPHGAPLACRRLSLSPLKSAERDALVLQLPGSSFWMELPAGSLLSQSEGGPGGPAARLWVYQPVFSTGEALSVTELRVMADDSDLGHAVISTYENSNGESSGLLYQQADGQRVAVGYQKEGIFVGVSAATFFTLDALDSKAILEYKVVQMQGGASLVLSSVPQTLVLQRDIAHYNSAHHRTPSVGRDAEDMLSMLHRLSNHYSSQGEKEAVNGALMEVNNKISKINGAAKEVATTMLRYKPQGGNLKKVVVTWTYTDASGELSVVLRLPVNMLDSPTSQGLLQQLQISLSLLMEDAASLPRALANRLSLYGTALHTLHKILGSGHCSSCPEGRKPCSFCRAVMFRDFVHVTIQGLGLSSDTMPDSLSWAEFRGQDFLLFAETASGPALLGVELDFHTDMLTRPSPRRKHLPQLATYAATCLNAHITSMVVKQKSSRSHCYGLNNYMKSLVQTLPMDKFAPLMNANVFRDAVIEGCNVRVEDAVTSCLEGDGELLALQRLPEFKVDGHSAIYDYVRSLLSPAPLASIDFSTIDLSSKPHVLSAAPTLSEFLSLLAKEAGSSGTRPLVDYLFRDEGSSQTSVISSGIDDAVAAKGHTPSAGSTFYVRLWSHPAKGLSILEGILANSETSQEGSSGQSDTSERSEDSDSEAVQQVQEYSRRLQRQQPDKHLLITRTLSWPENKDPENFNEARQFVDVASGVLLVPGAIMNLFDHRWNDVSSDVSRSLPERHVAEDVVPFLKRLSYSTPDAYGQVCQRLGWTTPRLPNTPEEAEAFVAALRDVRALQGPVRRWLADLGESVSTSTTWSQVKAIIDKAHGPHSKVPLFLPSSSKCHCVRSNALGRCYIDILKTTEDLIFRLSLLLPAVLAEHIKPKTKDLSTQAAALCAAAGVFVTAWQQQQVEAGLEHPNGRLAHSVLIERIRNSDKYSLADIDEDGIENTSEYNKRTKALKKHFSSGPMKKCFSLMSAGGTVAQQPAEMNGKRFAARSLYGGIANTVGVSALHADLFVQTILEAGSAIPRRPRPPHPFIGLFAALRVSQRFKDCFSASRDMTLRSWYLMHIEGDSILRRIGRHKVAEEIAAATYNFGTSQSSDHFDTAFKTLMATVTTQWEDAGAFKSLVSYFPGGEAIKLAEVAPEDFETPADSATDTGLEFSPNLLN